MYIKFYLSSPPVFNHLQLGIPEPNFTFFVQENVLNSFALKWSVSPLQCVNFSVKMFLMRPSFPSLAILSLTCVGQALVLSVPTSAQCCTSLVRGRPGLG